ncbi:MAG: class I SAM-dependent methyltransferase [Candidatus Doudnabacteria bacterium]|nr:class I SAM-dependent methyltransferase [Candidatus Doudnabacteria bacterium]
MVSAPASKESQNFTADMKAVYKSTTCLVCGHGQLRKFLDLGSSALANSYLTKQQLKRPELKVPLQVYYCPSCHLVQLTDIVDRELIYNDYDYFSSTSPQLVEHFENFADEIYTRFPQQTMQLTVEIASNDGVLLKHFQNLGAPILGIDPAKNIARQAEQNGIRTLQVFFNEAVAEKIRKKYGVAGIITANNVLAHTDDIHSIIAGVKKLLAPTGVFVFEVQYIGELINKGAFDNIYHEHICYYSLAPLIKLMNRWGLEAFDIQFVDTHGGSIRVYACHTDAFPTKKSIPKLLRQEERNGLHQLQTYKNFSAKPLAIKKELVSLIKKLKQQNQTLVGYGASAKGTSLLQFCEIGPEYIDYIVDNAPSKQGKFTPGTHIPILKPEVLKKYVPTYVLLLAWNYANSIMKKENWLKKQGVKFIIPIPKVVVI